MKTGYLGGLAAVVLGLVGCSGNTDSCDTGRQQASAALLNAWEENDFQDRNAAWKVQPDAAPCSMNDDAKKAVRDAHGDAGADRLAMYERLCGNANVSCVEG